jgi:hypothetical protein
MSIKRAFALTSILSYLPRLNPRTSISACSSARQPLLFNSSSARTMATASHVQLDVDAAGVYHASNITADSAKVGSELLQDNHDKHHMYFNKSGFHNHIAHHLLTIYALGATPEQIQHAFDINKGMQRQQFPIDSSNVEAMKDPEQFKNFFGKEQYFHDFETFFQKEIEDKGWENVLTEHVFARTEHADRILVRMYAGFLHPLIHLGFGVEFAQPAIIVEALAQACIHDAWVADFLLASEEAAKSKTNSKSLVQLIHESRNNKTLRESAHWSDGNKMRDGVFVRAHNEIIHLASQWTVQPSELEIKTAEMINAATYFTGASQNPKHAVKFDFFYMHCTNCSIFFSAFSKQKWLKDEDKARLLEWKGRYDLAMYVSRGCPELRIEEVRDYTPKKPDDRWEGIIQRVDGFPDDGHAAKLVRAFANAEQVTKPYEKESDDVFPVKGDMFLKLGHMAIDSVEASGPHWVRSTGFEEAWKDVPARSKL